MNYNPFNIVALITNALYQPIVTTDFIKIRHINNFINSLKNFVYITNMYYELQIRYLFRIKIIITHLIILIIKSVNPL